jgi:chromosome segregation ATPase
MTKLTDSLRDRAYSFKAIDKLCDEAADEIERLVTVCETYAHSSAGACREIASLKEAIRRLADQDAALSVVNGDVIVQMDCQDSLQENLTLTAKEREAIEWYAGYGRDGLYADTLRGLLERTK